MKYIVKFFDALAVYRECSYLLEQGKLEEAKKLILEK